MLLGILLIAMQNIQQRLMNRVWLNEKGILKCSTSSVCFGCKCYFLKNVLDWNETAYTGSPISVHLCCYRAQNPHSLHFWNIVYCHNWTQYFWTVAPVTFDMNSLWSLMEVLNNFWTDSWCVHWLKTPQSPGVNRFSLFYYTVLIFHVMTQTKHVPTASGKMSDLTRADRCHL